MRRRDSNLDYYSCLERKVERVLWANGIRYRHGIAVDPIRGLEAVKLPDESYYVPDFILPDYPGIFIECKGIAFEEWADKYENLRELGLRVLLVIPSEEERFCAENSCDACLTVGEVESIPEMIKKLRALNNGKATL